MVPYQIITAVCCLWISVCVQEVVPAPISSSARRPLRLADRLGPAGQSNAQESRGHDDLALLQVHARS